MHTIEDCKVWFETLVQLDDKDIVGRWLKFEEECGEAAREILIQYNEQNSLRATAHRETTRDKIEEELVDMWLTYIAYARPEAFPLTFEPWIRPPQVPRIVYLKTKNGELDAVPALLGARFLPMLVKKLTKWETVLSENGLDAHPSKMRSLC